MAVVLHGVPDGGIKAGTHLRFEGIGLVLYLRKRTVKRQFLGQGVNATDFQRSYVLISQRLGTGLVPHFLAPLGTERRWFQADNLHPVAAAQPLLAEEVLKALDALPPR